MKETIPTKISRLYNTRLLTFAIGICLGSCLWTNNLHANQPKLFEPYAPKPSGKAPDGWEIKILEGSQVENTSTLSGNKEIKVTVPAYEIVPKKSEGIIVTKDPGFDPRLANAQKETIGAILTEYSEKTTELQTKLEKVTKDMEKRLGVPTTPPNSENQSDKSDSSQKSTQTNDKKTSNNSSR